MAGGFAELVANSRSSLVYLAKLKEAKSGADAWYYVQIKNKILLPIFLKEMETSQHIKLNNFGTVLYSGWGQEPPEDIKQKIKEQFG